MGRPATGLKRPHPQVCNLSAEEFEALARESHETKKSRTELLREAYFRNGWRRRTIELRRKQRNLPVEWFVPKDPNRSIA